MAVQNKFTPYIDLYIWCVKKPFPIMWVVLFTIYLFLLVKTAGIVPLMYPIFMWGGAEIWGPTYSKVFPVCLPANLHVLFGGT